RHECRARRRVRRPDAGRDRASGHDPGRPDHHRGRRPAGGRDHPAGDHAPAPADRPGPRLGPAARALDQVRRHGPADPPDHVQRLLTSRPPPPPWGRCSGPRPPPEVYPPPENGTPWSFVVICESWLATEEPSPG